MKISPVYVAAGGAVAAAALYVAVRGAKGAAQDVGQAVGSAAVDLVDGVVTGGVTAVSEKIGIPTPDETIKDAQACKIYMDKYGKWKAAGACSAPAFFEALTL